MNRYLRQAKQSPRLVWENVNAQTGQFWVIDYRLYDPAGDGKTQLDHVIEMLNHRVETKQLPIETMLMDSWYATQKVMEHTDHLGKIYYCPLQVNRLGDDTGGVEKYNRIDQLQWNALEQQQRSIGSNIGCCRVT